MARSREQVIELLGKLRNITFDNGATLEESKVAAAHVERLLAEHNLSMFDVEQQVFKEDITEEALLTDETQCHQWMRTLSFNIGNALNCKTYSGVGRNQEKERYCINLTFIGHDADATVARFLYETLSVQLYAMGSIAAKKAGRRGREIVTYRSIFIESAAREIGARLLERQNMQETLAEAAGGATACTQMVHVKTAALDTYIENKPRWAKATKYYSKGYQAYDYQAQADGRVAGQEVPLHRGDLGGKTSGDRPLLT